MNGSDALAAAHDVRRARRTPAASRGCETRRRVADGEETSTRIAQGSQRATDRGRPRRLASGPLGLGFVVLAACGGSGRSADASDGAVDEPPFDGTAAEGAIEPLVAEAGPALRAFVGDDVVFDGSRSRGAVSFRWSFGDGTQEPRADEDPTARHRYGAPGRYTAVLEVRDALGRRRSDATSVSVTHRPVFRPSRSSSVAVWPGQRRVAVVSPDSAEVTLVRWDDEGRFEVEERQPTAADPRTVAVVGARLVVACQDGNAVSVLWPGQPDRRIDVAAPHASRPFGVLAVSEREAWVSLQALGAIARLHLPDEGAPRLDPPLPAVEDARGLALLPDGRIAVARWRSPDDGAQIAVVDPTDGRRELWRLRVDPQDASDTEIGGVPSYLNDLLVSPDGRTLYVPSLQASLREGRFRGPRPLTFETTVRAVVSVLDIATGLERFELRKQFDNRGFAAAGALNAHGDELYVVDRGMRAVERLDVLRWTQSGSILDVGHAPQGVAVSEDDRWLFVDAYLSRRLVVFALGDWSRPPTPVATLPVASHEPLSPSLLRGKRLFNDAADRRIARDGYIACAHCHLDGASDRRVWYFTDRGEGLRNTIDLRGGGGTAHGPIHWSANFDEVQDFEHDIRGAFGGTGLLDDALFRSGGRDSPLGAPKAGLSADLDALAEYVSSLTHPVPSPHCPPGVERPEVERGRRLFEARCTGCHTPPRMTDSAWLEPARPRLHDVGTLTVGSGSRLGGTLDGLDTPTLLGVWDSPPYLHDGSAATLEEVLVTRNRDDRHGRTSDLDAAQIADLVAFLLCL
ncbi:MAG: PKD domain-containing protein [Myxococcota bacterium]|nr:PKD domain-containing protein [Myxococcota bacterium]